MLLYTNVCVLVSTVNRGEASTRRDACETAALRERERACVRERGGRGGGGTAVRGGGAWLAWLACLGELWVALAG